MKKSIINPELALEDHKNYENKIPMRFWAEDDLPSEKLLLKGTGSPSGNIQPSEADQKITKKIKECGILLDMAVLDHIIVAGDRYYSFADEGTL